MTGMADRWSFWIDRGGTFTDVVAVSSDGERRTAKLLSADPSYDDAATEAIRRVLGVATGTAIPSDRVVEVRMGTTVATNALHERRGEPTLLLITKGFADALRIGDQHRPHIFRLHIERPEQLTTRIVEVDERVRADGSIRRPLDLDAALTAMRAAHADGMRAVAIALLHGDRYPDHEQRLAATAGDVGFTQISVSYDVSSLPRLVPRAETTVVDAYLSPVLDRYIAGVAGELGEVPLRFMQSNGGLADADAFRGRDAIVSGPAGGVVGMTAIAEAAGFDRAIGFDMGGTSTDVSLYSGRFERTLDTVVAGVRVRAPMLDIHTIAAGGGSILRFDGARYRVGPDSAGADPGPACYRRGGPMTLTDANVILGRIVPAEFPAVFGAGGDEPLDAEASASRCAELAAQIGEAAGTAPPLIEEVAAGFVEIAVDNMVNAIRKVSIERGHDVTRYVLISFGGAGGQHACAIADALGIDTILVHPLAGVLSAYGMGLAQRRTLRERSVERPLDASGTAEAVTSALDDLEADARIALAGDRRNVPGSVSRRGPGSSEDRDADRVEVERRIHLRYEGTDTALDVPEGERDTLAASFEDAYRKRFSFLPSDRPFVVEAVSVEAIDVTPTALSHDKHQDSASSVTQKVAEVVTGPAVVAEATATTVIDAGWSASADGDGVMIVRRRTPRPRAAEGDTDVEPVRLEVFANRFMAIAEQMGTRLAGSSQSVNIKERLDFSCALFDANGGLVANAPHIPVHL
nr:hydantoinase B/oxoprolinase family protein [Actinomycetota bacterium]